MAKIGYARVSTTDQDLDVQHDKLRDAGCEIIRSEKVPDASRDGREELQTIIAFLRPGDELIVARLDSLGRDTRDVLNIIHECEQRGAHVTILDPYVSTLGEMGHLVLTVLGMVEQMERRFIKERQRDGIERAKANGVYKGGTRRIARKLVLEMKSQGLSPTCIAREIGCSRMQVYRIINATYYRLPKPRKPLFAQC